MKGQEDTESRALLGLLERYLDAGEILLGSGARDDVLAGLSSPAPRVREVAVQLAWEVMDDEVARAVIAIVQGDDEASIRANAAISLGPVLEECDLGDFDDEYDPMPIAPATFANATTVLHRVYLDAAAPKLVRRRALEAAVRCQDDWQQAAVRAAFKSGDAEWQATALFCMGYLNGFEPLIVEGLKASDLSVRIEAIRAAGQAVVDDAFDTVVRVAGDETAPKEERIAAIEALAHLTGPGSADLLEVLSRHDDPEVSESAGAALGEQLMWESLEGEASALGFVDDEEFMEGFRSFSDDDEEW